MLRLAIPVTEDGESIEIRMGHAAFFKIYEIEGEQFKVIGLFENEHEGHSHHHGNGHHTENEADIRRHHRDLGELKHCDTVLVRGLGPNMKAALQMEGITILRAKSSLGETAGELVQVYCRDPESFTKIV